MSTLQLLKTISIPFNVNELIDDENKKLGEKKHGGDIIKSVIFGGIDGILTLFAIIASVSGSNINGPTIFVLGISKLIADGISMGIGDFLSEKAEIDFIKSEYEREKWEFENYTKAEVQEMIDIYLEKGINENDAKLILNTMSKYPKLFLDHMMYQELELNIKQIENNPIKNGFITFASFIIFGFIPLISYIFIPTLHSKYNYNLIIAIILTSFTLFAIGSIKGYYCKINIFKSGLLLMLNGGITAVAAYFIALKMRK